MWVLAPLHFFRVVVSLPLSRRGPCSHFTVEQCGHTTRRIAWRRRPHHAPHGARTLSRPRRHEARRDNRHLKSNVPRQIRETPAVSRSTVNSPFFFKETATTEKQGHSH